MFRKPRSTQRPGSSDRAPGHVGRSPSGHAPQHGGSPQGGLTDGPSAGNAPETYGPRTRREVVRLSNITVERARTDANPLSRRLTKFTQNFTGQVKIPHDMLSRDRSAAADQAEGDRCLDVGQIPED